MLTQTNRFAYINNIYCKHKQSILLIRATHHANTSNAKCKHGQCKLQAKAMQGQINQLAKPADLDYIKKTTLTPGYINHLLYI